MNIYTHSCCVCLSLWMVLTSTVDKRKNKEILHFSLIMTQAATLGRAFCLNTRRFPQASEYTWPLLETVTHGSFCLWPAPASLPLVFQLCQQQTTLTRSMLKLKVPGIRSPYKTEEAVMTNAEWVCPSDLLEEGPLWQSNCGPEKGWFRVAPLCKHRLSCPVRAHPFSSGP